jgi:ribosome-associated toxin RatA of RatAB toxin-antitoxin module
MATHSATVTVNAHVSQVYQLWTHFNDFPKFMTFIKEVTYKDDQTSHWVADIIGHHEWDAVNDAWIENRQIGWKSTDGLENSGVARFESINANETSVTIYIKYNPPAGFLGDIGEALGGGGRFEMALQRDLTNFAEMVNQAPAGALDPTSSAYLFHAESAAGKGETTAKQDETHNEFTADDPHFNATVNPPSINRNFTTDMRDDLADDRDESVSSSRTTD